MSVCFLNGRVVGRVRARLWVTAVLQSPSISDLRLSITLQDNEADAPLIKEMEDGICVVSCQNHALALLQIISHR